jgi:PTH2 family peptidyl-tRNA hydrolase
MLHSYKQVVVVRKDLKLGKGKLAAQVAHASIGSMKKARKRVVKLWESEGSKKVVLKVDDLQQLKNIRRKAACEKLPSFIVSDAGLTQIRGGTITCLGIGPAAEEKIDKVTKDLKLL